MEIGIFITKIPVSFCKIGKFVLRGARIATRFLETSPRHIILKNVTGDLVMKEENPDKMITYRDISRIPMEMRHNFEDALKMQDFFNGNTTLGVVLTNAKMDKTTLNKVASMAHNGYGRAIRPVHTMADGDSIYAVSTGEQPADVNLVGPLAAYVMGKAIGRAVLAAEPAAGLKAACQLEK